MFIFGPMSQRFHLLKKMANNAVKSLVLYVTVGQEVPCEGTVGGCLMGSNSLNSNFQSQSCKWDFNAMGRIVV